MSERWRYIAKGIDNKVKNQKYSGDHLCQGGRCVGGGKLTEMETEQKPGVCEVCAVKIESDCYICEECYDKHLLEENGKLW